MHEICIKAMFHKIHNTPINLWIGSLFLTSKFNNSDYIDDCFYIGQALDPIPKYWLYSQTFMIYFSIGIILYEIIQKLTNNHAEERVSNRCLF